MSLVFITRSFQNLFLYKSCSFHKNKINKLKKLFLQSFFFFKILLRDKIQSTIENEKKVKQSNEKPLRKQ